MNSRGLRTPEYELHKGPGSRRIVLVGDSFLLIPSGPGDRFHISNCLRREAGRDGRPLEVINFGVENTGPRYYLRMMELEACRLGADCVIVFLFVGNDMTDEAVQVGPAPPGERLAQSSYAFRLFRTCRALATEVPFTSLASYLSSLNPERRTTGGYYDGGGYWTAENPVFTEEAWFDIQLMRSAVFEEPWSSGIRQQWEEMVRVLGDMKRTADDAHTGLLVVLIPDVTQIDTSIQSRIRTIKGGIKLDFDKPQRELRAACGRLGIETVDLLPAFRNASGQRRPVYRIQDSHWTAYAQWLAAKLVTPAAIRTAQRSP